MAASGTSILENLSPATRGHPGSKTMNAQSAAFFGLVCTFWHDVILSLNSAFICFAECRTIIPQSAVLKKVI
jgi:hypothetical protein